MGRLRLVFQKKSFTGAKWDTGTVCSENLWMPYPWMCTRPDWRGLWAAWCGGWHRWFLKIPSNPNCSVMLWLDCCSSKWFPEVKAIVHLPNLIAVWKNTSYIYFLPLWKQKIHLNMLLFFLIREYWEEITQEIFFVLCSVSSWCLFISALNW